MDTGYIYPSGATTAQSNAALYFYSNTSREILTDTAQLTDKFYKGYQDLYNDLQNYYNVPASDARMYWLQNAVEINSNNSVQNPNDPLGLSNIFIRDVTRNGLLYEGFATLSNVDTKVQANSNLIGQYVLGAIFGYKDGVITPATQGVAPSTLPGIDDFIQKDIGSALAKGRQSYQGWGGSFYFWDTPLGKGQTIGGAILSNGTAYEEFLAVTAKAMVDTISAALSGLATSFIDGIESGINAIGTALGGQVPVSVEEDIIDRIVEAPDFGYGGDPDIIDGYHAVLDNQGNIAGWSLNGGPAQQSIALNARRAARLNDSPDSVWQSGSTVQPQVAPNNVQHNNVATASQATGITHSNTTVLAATTTVENQPLVLDVLPASGSPPLQTSGINAPSALGGTVSIVNGTLVYTPNQDYVGRDFVFLTTYDGSQYKTTLVPVTVTGQAHQTVTQNADGSTTTNAFDQTGTEIGGRTVHADGTYDVLSYNTLGGQTYLLERDHYSQTGSLLTTTTLQPDGYVATTTDDSASAGSAPVVVSAGSSVTISTPDTGIQVNGAGATVNVAALGATISIGSGTVNVLANAGATINGSSNTVTFNANGVGFINGTGNTINFAAAGSNVAASNATLNLLQGATAVVTGNIDTATMTNNATLWLSGATDIVNVSGTGDIVAIANGTVNLAANAGATLAGNGNTVTLGTSAALTATGTGTIVTATGQQATASLNSATVTVASGASAAISGGSNAVALSTSGAASITGTNNIVTVSGTGNSATASSAQVTLQAGARLTLAGQSDTIALASNTGLDASAGSGHSLNVTGSHVEIAASSSQINLQSGTGAHVTGNGDTITLAGNDSLVASGNTDSLTLTGTNNAATIAGTGTTVAISGTGHGITASSAAVTLNAGATATVQGNADSFTVLNTTGLDASSGTGDVVAVAGTGAQIALQAGAVNLQDGSGAQVWGNGNTFTFVGSTTLAAPGTNDTFVFTPASGTTTISNGDLSDNFQFSKSTFANWQALLSHATQSGADTVIQLDPHDTLTLKGATLTSLNQSHFQFN